MKNKLLIFGSSGHSSVVIDAVEKSGDYEIAGLLDDFRKPGEKTLDYAVLGDTHDLPALLDQHKNCHFFVAIGDNWTRSLIASKIRALKKDIVFATIIHPSAQIGRNVKIGQGSVVMAGVVLNSGSVIGRGCIVNTLAGIDHDCALGDYASIAPNAVLGGNVVVEEHSAVSIGATIKQGVKIGQHTVVGAGSVVLKDFGDRLTVYGAPARIISERNIGDVYL